MSLHHYRPSPEIKWAAINCTAGGTTTIVSAVASKKIRIKSITFVCSSGVTIEFRSDANIRINAMYFDAYGGMTEEYFGDEGYFMETNSGEAFGMYLSGASNVRGCVNYQEI